MKRPACRISLQDFITEISGSIAGAARRMPPADLALVRVRVRFSATVEHRRKWFGQRGRPAGIVLNFRPGSPADVNGELYFDGSGRLLEPPAAHRKGDDSDGIQ